MNAGRPALFSNNEELQSEVDSYFQYLEGEFEMIDKRDDEGNLYQEKIWIRYPENATITGLALYLGFESRQSVYDYEKNGEFSYTIKKARLKVENHYEQALLSKNSTGAIFALKNFGWSDKQEIDHRSADGSMSPKTKIVFNKGNK